MVAKMESAYANRAVARFLGDNGAAFMQGWGWPSQIDRLRGAVKDLC